MFIVIENKKINGVHEWEFDGEAGAVYVATYDKKDFYYRYDEKNDRYVADVKYGKERTDYYVQDLRNQKQLERIWPEFIIMRLLELVEIHRNECELLEL